MKNLLNFIFILFIVISFIDRTNSQEHQKVAQTGMKFLSVVVDARASALGDAVTSLEGGSSYLFLNPASMARLKTFADVSMGQMNWIADIKYLYGTAAFAPFEGDYGIVGLMVLSVDYGVFQGTIRANNELGYIETGEFNPMAFSVGVGYAKAFSDKFSVGGNVKWVKQDLGPTYFNFSESNSLLRKDNKKEIVAFDFGILYKTGFKSLNFGMVVRNFSKELKYEKEQFQLPLVFKIGLSMNVFDLISSIDGNLHSFLLSADAVHNRDYAEQINFGGEYSFMNMVSLRAGYSTPNDERGFSLGFGMKQSIDTYNIGLDYSYAPFGIFSSVHRFTVMFSL